MFCRLATNYICSPLLKTRQKSKIQLFHFQKKKQKIKKRRRKKRLEANPQITILKIKTVMRFFFAPVPFLPIDTLRKKSLKSVDVDHSADGNTYQVGLARVLQETSFRTSVTEGFI